MRLPTGQVLSKAFLEHRGRWQPGESPNPTGENGKKPLTQQLKEQLATKVPNDPNGRTYLQLMIESGIKRAITKSDTLLQHIWDRMEGRVTPDPEAADSGNRTTVVLVDVPRPARNVRIESVGPTIAMPAPKPGTLATRSQAAKVTSTKRVPEKEEDPVDPRPPQ